jgi:hypothetical protein
MLLDNPPKIKTKTLLRFINNPSTFSEATGYAVLSNDCDTINEIINKSLYFQIKPLQTLLNILTQSKCRVVKGYLTVLASSKNLIISQMAKSYLKEYENNLKKVFIYQNKSSKE